MARPHPRRPQPRPRHARRAAALALLLACPFAPAQSPAKPPTRKQIDTAIDRGVQHLLEAQTLEGRWTWKQQMWNGRSGSTALAMLALVRSGVSPKHGAIQRGIASLESNKTEQTYDAACVTLALLAVDSEKHAQWISSLIQQFTAEQRTDGWGYPSNFSDLSNTQYATLALWTAHRAGFEVDAAVWPKLASALPLYAKRRSGFSYQIAGKKKTPGMTAAGIGCIAICRELLGGSLAPLGDERLVKQLDKIYDKSLGWIGKQCTVRGIRRLKENGVGYYLYSIERIGALTGHAKFGEVDWYTEGARYLIDEQREDGSWSHLYSESTGTSFALLFLTRATTGPTTGGKRRGEQESTELTPWLVEIARDFGRNVVPTYGRTASASSTYKKSHKADFAFDGDRTTSWQCRERDKKPSIRVEFAAPVPTHVIRIGHAYDPKAKPSAIGRATKVDVIINGDQKFQVQMPAHPLDRGKLEFNPPQQVRTLELKCIEREPHPDGTLRIGFSEIEILSPPK